MLGMAKNTAELKQHLRASKNRITIGGLTSKLTLLIISMSLVSVLLNTALLPQAKCGIWDPFHTKAEKIALWKELWDAYPHTEYKTIGKTYNGNDIWLFVVGNTSGPAILWDGELHGSEDKGSEILFLIAKWLLGSNDTQAKRILEKNFVMFIPVINERNVRGNSNTELSPYGVDLNRNFETGWTKSNPNTEIYSGEYPVSEPETKVLRSVFLTYKPIFYVNMHVGAGPYAAYYRGSDIELTDQVISRTQVIAQNMDITPYRTLPFGSNGFAIGDAVMLGVKSAWLIEAVGQNTAWKHLPEHYDELVNVFFPKCLALFIAMCEISVLKANSQMLSDQTTETTSTPFSVSSVESANTNIANRTTNLADCDLCIISMTAKLLPTIKKGETIPVNITIFNNSTQTEISNLKLHANNMLIATQQITLQPNNITNITLLWNTANITEGNYTLTAHIQPITNETNIANNTFKITDIQIIGAYENNQEKPPLIIITASTLLIATLLLPLLAQRLKRHLKKPSNNKT